MSQKNQKNIFWFNELTNKDVPLVGGKNASLGEMYQKLTKKGVNIPNGFATTSHAYNDFLEGSGAKEKIRKVFADLDTHDIRNLMTRGAKVRRIIMRAKFPKHLEREIVSAYKKLSKNYKVANVDVAVRSSATAEDLPDASFAGQQETFLNIKGEKALLVAVKKCIASLFTNRAISYREDKGFDHFDIALSVGVQKMVRSDKGSSGVMFTIDTESGFENVVLINSIYGLGENIVQGKVTPDEFYYFKPTGAIISKTVADKDVKMIYNTGFGRPVKDVPVEDSKRKKQSITDAQVKKLAEWGMIVEKHYGRPMDMEWALDGKDKKLYVVQARPETVHSVKNQNFIEEFKLKEDGKIIVEGQSVGQKIGAGKANRIMGVEGITQFKPGEVLVTSMTDPDWEPIMKIASAIVTDKGGRTCHAAIVSRELGIPCIVGTEIGSDKINTGDKVTINCAEGEKGKVHKGILDFEIKKTNIGKLKKSKTKIMMNIGEPDLAFSNSFIPNDGVGLARLEFIINNTIKAHPLALVNYKKQNREVKKEIDKITIGYKNKKEFFVDKLAEGVGRISAAFYPKPVIVRLSDFKSNEYANLIGGQQYEPIESNPMIGWRGASRFYSKEFLPAFELECKALAKVRDEMGLTNMKIMVPFCRTVEEGKKVLEIMAKYGLKRGKNPKSSKKNGQGDLEVYVMAEIPSNILLAEEFAKIFDGFSIGSNDLTQLTLGIDRDSSGTLEVAGVSNENNEAVKILVEDLVRKAKKLKTKVGICGQAPSDFPEFVEFLVGCKIDSISLIPDTIVKTTMNVNKRERNGKN